MGRRERERERGRSQTHGGLPWTCSDASVSSALAATSTSRVTVVEVHHFHWRNSRAYLPSSFVPTAAAASSPALSLGLSEAAHNQREPMASSAVVYRGQTGWTCVHVPFERVSFPPRSTFTLRRRHAASTTPRTCPPDPVVFFGYLLSGPFPFSASAPAGSLASSRATRPKFLDPCPSLTDTRYTFPVSLSGTPRCPSLSHRAGPLTETDAHTLGAPAREHDTQHARRTHAGLRARTLSLSTQVWPSERSELRRRRR